MELKQSKISIFFYYTYQRQGNDKNGNPIYIVNIFYDCGSGEKVSFINMNCRSDRRIDKYGNIKMQSYNIDESIESIIKSIQ
jgi:hypothetical protein